MSLCLMQPHALKPYVSKNVCIHLHNLLTSGVDGGEWPQVTLSKGCCTCEEKSLGSHRIEGCMGLNGGLCILENRKITFPRRELNHISSTI